MLRVSFLAALQFGMGLKDALAGFDRRPAWRSARRTRAITTGRRPKEGFPDVATLHAPVAPPSDPWQIGTDVMLSSVRDADVETAKHLFLRYSGERCWSPPSTATS